MRNASAAAHFDDDFALREPPRRKAARRPAGKAKKKQGLWSAIKVNPQRLFKRAAIGASVLVALGIVVNALELQKGRHPAPLFGTSVTIAEEGPHASSPAKAAPTAPLPVPKPVLHEASSPAAADQTNDDMSPSAALNAKLSQMTSQAPAHQPGPNASTDEIAHLLEHGSAPRAQPAHPSAPRPQPAARPVHAASKETHDARTVYGVQQALVKLGFVLKPNGVYGPQTKKAIELFGKERNLSTNGDLSPRVVKVLAAESGLKIEHP